MRRDSRKLKRSGPLSSTAEQRTHNPLVGGSNPPGATKPSTIVLPSSWLRDHNGEVVHRRPAFKELVDIQTSRTSLWIEHLNAFACSGDYNERVNIRRRDVRSGDYVHNWEVAVFG